MAKDTDATKRVKIEYDADADSLKIEVSYRDPIVEGTFDTTDDGIVVYDIQMLMSMKSLAIYGRTWLRALYDLAYICVEHYDEMSVYELLIHTMS